LDRLKRFDEGGCKLITATTVAEEGIDIRACNLVVTYNHTTSEVAQVQRKGDCRFLALLAIRLDRSLFESIIGEPSYQWLSTTVKAPSVRLTAVCQKHLEYFV